MTEGCVVTAAGRSDCEVATAGMPVMTPSELVSVRKDVKPLVYVYEEEVESWNGVSGV